jgi:hypothetical protein
MKMPVPTCLLSSSHHKIAGYDASAFLPASFDVGGRALTAQTGLRHPSSVLSVILVAALTCAIAVLAVAAADSDELTITNRAVIVRYSEKVEFGVAPVRRDDSMADAAIARLNVWENQRLHLGIGTLRHFVAPIFLRFVPTGAHYPQSPQRVTHASPEHNPQRGFINPFTHVIKGNELPTL